MTLQLQEPSHVEEPRQAEEYAEILGRVAANGQAIIVRRGGADLAAVVPLELLDLLREMLAREHAERLAASIDWDRLVRESPPSQEWFDRDEPKPF